MSKRTSQGDEQEEFYRQMDTLFGPLDHSAPTTRPGLQVPKRRKTVELEDGRQMAGGSGRAETESAQTAHTAVESPAPNPTPIASVPLVPEEPEADIRQPNTSTATVHTTPTVVQNHYYYGVGTVNHTTVVGDTERARVQETVRPNEAARVGVRPGSRTVVDSKIFTVLDVDVQYPECDVHNAIIRILASYGIASPVGSVSLIPPHIRGMPQAASKRFYANFTVTPAMSNRISTILEEREMFEIGLGGKKVSIKNQQSYDDILEQEVLQIGLRLLSTRLTPIIPRIEGKTIVYSPAELPNNRITVTLRNLLSDDGVLAEITETLNKPARRTIQSMIQ